MNSMPIEAIALNENQRCYKYLITVSAHNKYPRAIEPILVLLIFVYGKAAPVYLKTAKGIESF